MGTFAYGTSYFGLRAFDQTTGVVHDASASASASASIAPVGWVSNIGSGEISTSVASSATASAQQFVLVLSSKYSYGTSAYGSHTYGQAYLEFGTSAASAGVTDGTETRVRVGAANISGSVSGSASARRVPEGSALVYGTSSNTVNTTGNGARIRTGYAAPAATATGSTAQATRVRESASNVSASASASANSVFLVSAEAAGAASASILIPGAATFISTGSLSASASASAEADLVLDSGSIEGAGSAVITQIGAATFKGSAAVSVTASNTAFAGYVYRSGAAISVTSAIVVVGREKWETIPVGSNTWNSVPVGSTAWTKLAA